MYTMMQACRETDMTYQALKYYCNEGLVPNVKRDKNNRRIFDEKSRECIGKVYKTVVEGYDPYTDSYFGRTWRDAPEIDGAAHFTCGYELHEGDMVEIEVFDVRDCDLIGEVI